MIRLLASDWDRLDRAIEKAWASGEAPAFALMAPWVLAGLEDDRARASFRLRGRARKGGKSTYETPFADIDLVPDPYMTKSGGRNILLLAPGGRVLGKAVAGRFSRLRGWLRRMS